MIDRRFERVSVKVPMFITVGGGRLYEKAVSIESCDISGGGLCFETRSKIPLSAESKIIMGRLGDLPGSALIEGRIVYRRKQKGTERYTVGVEFIEFVNTTRDEVLHHIDLWCKKERATPDKSGD
ncbi:MAG: PilZ domain-containing protein [Acidobacteria bacterium]|nr:MAG: PilZ domain-containing protein [Acidobacteriota bacterium]